MQQIDEEDKDQLKTGVTLQSIAEACGVSIATVSRALKNPSMQSKATVERIRLAAEAMGYNPDLYHSARRMALHGHGKQSQNHLLALLFPKRFYYALYFNYLFQGLLEVLTKEGYGLLTLEQESDEETALPPSLFRGDVDGLMLCTRPEPVQPLLQALRESPGFADRPIVSLIERLAGYSLIKADRVGGARAAVGHLLDQGHRHILYLLHLDKHDKVVRPDQELYLGYSQACVERGLTPEEHLHPGDLGEDLWDIAFLPTNYPRLASVEAICASAKDVPLLHDLRQHPITAVVTPNDTTALIMYHLLQQQGLRVPEDMSLIGFDDTIPLINRNGDEILTSVRLPLIDVGRKAAQLMLDKIDGKVTGEKVEILPCTLIERMTTAPPARRQD